MQVLKTKKANKIQRRVKCSSDLANTDFAVGLKASVRLNRIGWSWKLWLRGWGGFFNWIKLNLFELRHLFAFFLFALYIMVEIKRRLLPRYLIQVHTIFNSIILLLSLLYFNIFAFYHNGFYWYTFRYYYWTRFVQKEHREWSRILKKREINNEENVNFLQNISYVKKITRLKLYLPRKKWTMN